MIKPGLLSGIFINLRIRWQGSFEDWPPSRWLVSQQRKLFYHSKPQEYSKAYVVLGFCYQFGVLISRSSLYFFKVKKVWILTTLQIFNFVLWLFIALFKFVNIYVQFVLMIWVGLMGGCSYVNVMYLILEDPAITKNEKELAVNLCTVTNDTGILISAIYVLLMDNTFLKN